jgi:flavin reductase (DIM6/NTAB) family NADH-FMN oxidoreductase RutF
MDQEMTMNAFTNAMRRAVSSVSIVTTSGDFGRYGLTVSSIRPCFSSASTKAALLTTQ